MATKMQSGRTRTRPHQSDLEKAVAKVMARQQRAKERQERQERKQREAEAAQRPARFLLNQGPKLRHRLAK